MSDISVIITSYNAERSIQKAIKSVVENCHRGKIEVIVVDDCSQDNTCQKVEELAKQYPNIKLIRLEANTGSPSTPRNIGIQEATSPYITFLDDDDYINPSALLEFVSYATEKNLDFLKGYLKVVKNSGIEDANRIDDIKFRKTPIETIISKQSTTVDMILKRQFLVQHNIKFDGRFKIGEDTLFYSNIIKHKPKVEYVDKFYYFYNKVGSVSNLASTQSYGDRELSNHLDVWQLAEQNFAEVGLSYYKLRLAIAVKNTIINLVRLSHTPISEEIFNRLSDFVVKEAKYLNHTIVLHKRYKEVYDAVVEKDYTQFIKVSKKRMVIAGYDLKFILPVIKYLENDLEIQIDEWKGHNIHSEKESRKLLEWADIIWCEWLLGNAVWYSNNKYIHQSMVIRAHRFEIGREFGHQVKYSEVNQVITVGYYYFEKFAETFKIPREKITILSNYVEPEIYEKNKQSDYKKHIAIVGILPKRKGYLKALNLLNDLIKMDDTFKLYVMGATPEETPWIQNDKLEKQYYEQCREFIIKNSLENHLIIKGWVDKNKMFEEVGYVLSLSDNEVPESFHLTPAEAICSGTMGLYLNWPGVEYIYPNDIIFNSLGEIKEFILNTYQDEARYQAELENSRMFIMNNYTIDKFIKQIKNILTKSMLNI